MHAEWIEGHITDDTTWTAADSPYVLSNDVYVDEGATLTIEPGTEVRFGGPFSIFVDGALNAIGTKNDMIVFTSNRLDPTPGSWGSITFAGKGTSTLYIRHCSIKYGTSGVRISSSKKGSIKNCEIANNSNWGIFIGDEANVLIKENTLESNGDGIRIILDENRLHNVTITGNVIERNDVGIDVYTRGPNICNIIITDNIIKSNDETGVYFHDGCDMSKAIISDMTISGNVIEANGGNGIYFNSEGGHTKRSEEIYNITFSDNIVLRNQCNGIYVFSAVTRISWIHDLLFSDNDLSENGGNGICIEVIASDSHIHDVAISDNVVSANKANGVYINPVVYWPSNYLYNLMVSDNIISENIKDGIHIYSVKTNSDKTSYAPYIYNTMIFNNNISLNKETGMKISGRHCEGVGKEQGGMEYCKSNGGDMDFDLYISSNNILANHDGIIVCNKGADRGRGNLCLINVTGNSIAYNSEKGIFLYSGGISAAHFNDIYNNENNILSGSIDKSTNAENNYWGDPSGPYHESLNPLGVGNPVNGESDFIPFLTSPVNPIVENPVPDVAGALYTSNVEEVEDSYQIYTDPAIEDDSTLPTSTPTIDKYITSEGAKNTIPGFEVISVIIVVFILAYLWKQGRGGSNE